MQVDPIEMEAGEVDLEPDEENVGQTKNISLRL